MPSHDAAAERELARIAGLFRADLPRLRDRQLAALARFEAYEVVPADDLTRSVERNVLRLASILAGDPAAAAGLEDESTSLQRRLQQGVPSDVVVTAHRTVIACLRDEFIALTRRESSDPDLVLRGMHRIWDVTDRVLNGFVTARHEAELALTLRQEGRRADFFSRLLSGGVTPDELVEVGPLYDVHPRATYWLVLFAEDDARLIAEIERAGRGHLHRAVLGHLRGRAVALVSREISRLSDPTTTVACVGPEPAASIHRAAQVAQELLAGAAAFGMTGVLTPARMPLRLAVMRQPDIGGLLTERYITPLERSGAGGADLVKTVATYLAEDLSIQRTAERLYVHPNTVRYRLEKFRSLTGADFGRTAQLAELWWAFEHDAFRRAGGGQGTGAGRAVASGERLEDRD